QWIVELADDVFRRLLRLQERADVRHHVIEQQIEATEPELLVLPRQRDRAGGGDGIDLTHRAVTKVRDALHLAALREEGDLAGSIVLVEPEVLLGKLRSLAIPGGLDDDGYLDEARLDFEDRCLVRLGLALYRQRHAHRFVFEDGWRSCDR